MRVIVVGGGLGGLTLANALHRLKIDATVTLLERDRDAACRPQGYGITLRGPGGILVLRRLGLYEEFEKASRPDVGLRFLTPDGRTLLHLPPQPPSSDHYVMSVARGKLRAILLQGIPADTIRWGKRCVSYTVGLNPSVRLDDGSELHGDLIVACDGARSCLRTQMVGDSLRFIGLSGIGGQAQCQHPHPLIEGGTFMTLGRGKSIFVGTFDEGIVQWRLTIQAKEKEFGLLSPSELRELAHREVGDWHEPIPELIRNTADSAIACRDDYDRELSRTARDGKVVLLGDACHAMTPFRGQGGNSAMLDALKLAEALAAPGVSLDAALTAFDEEMLRRTRPLVLQSSKAARELHTTSRFVAWRRNTTYRLLNWIVGKTGPKQLTAQS